MRARLRKHLRRMGAFWICVVLWFVLSVAHFVFSYAYTVNESIDHGVVWSWSDFLIEWGKDYTENLQSEAWQVALAIYVVDRARAVDRWFRAKEEM